MREAKGSCRNGHDLSVLGLVTDGSCRACQRTRQARYGRSTKGRATQRTADTRYRKSPKGRATLARYKTSPMVTANHARAQARYENTPLGQIKQARSVLRRRLARNTARLQELMAALDKEMTSA